MGKESRRVCADSAHIPDKEFGELPLPARAQSQVSCRGGGPVKARVQNPYRRWVAAAVFGEKQTIAKKRKRKRDTEKEYPHKQFVTKLRRLADAIETGRRFGIQVAGERVSIPPDAIINIEHERGKEEEEIEFQLKWKRKAEAQVPIPSCGVQCAILRCGREGVSSTCRIGIEL